MKTRFTCWALLWATALGAQNFKQRSPEDRARYYTRQMAEQLSLDDSAIIKVYQINLDVSHRFDSLYELKDDFERRRGAAQIYQYRNEQYKKTLSTKQYLMFDDLERERRERKEKEKGKEKQG